MHVFDVCAGEFQHTTTTEAEADSTELSGVNKLRRSQ
jgi:hypothetical protein